MRFFFRKSVVVGATLWLLVSALAGAGEPPADLRLEEAIYTEQTLGDLPVAMAQYERLAQHKQQPAVAAQALCRLAVCHWKQGHVAEAQRVLRTMTAEFPEEKELARIATAFLREQRQLLPPVWQDGETLEYTLEFPTGIDAGFLAVMAHRMQHEDQEVWRLASLQNAPSYGGHSRRFVQVDATSYRPVYNEYDHQVLGSFRAFYGADHIRIVSTTTGTSGGEKNIPFEGPIYDYEQYWHVLRQLPLAVGYRTSLPVANCSQVEIEDLEIRVSGIEEVKCPAGTFSCFRVDAETRAGMQTTLWYSTDEARTLVAFDEWFIKGKLREIRHRGLADPMMLENRDYGVRWTAPRGWYLHERRTMAKPDELTVFAIPPRGREQVSIRVRRVPRDDATQSEALEETLSTLADRQFDEDQARRKGLLIRKGTRQFTRGSCCGQMSYSADFVDAGEPMAQYVVCLRDEEREVCFMAQGAPAAEPTFRKVVDDLVESYESF